MVAYYGGGANLSTLDDQRKIAFNKGTEAEVSLLRNFKKFVSTGDSSDPITMVPNILAKCVLFAIGFNPFEFVVNSVGEVPSENSLS